MNKLAWLGIVSVLFFVPSLANAIDLTPPASDASVMYLSYIFGVVNGVLSGSGTQIIGKMFGVFNMAVLMLASLIAVYTTIMAVLNTGQDGEFLGKKWSSLFVPVRMLFGVMLISPTSTGYSWIQVAVMWIVLQGIGSANYVWQEAILYLQGGGSLFVAGETTSLTNQYYTQTFQSMVPLSDSVFCLEAMDKAITSLTTNSAYYNGSPANFAPPTISPYNTVMNTLTADASMTSSTIPTTTINMPNYPTVNSSTGVSAATNPDVNWSFLNGVCGALKFSGGLAETNTDGTYTNVSALALQQALYDLDVGIYLPTYDICSITCQFPDSTGTLNPNCITPASGGTPSTCCQVYGSMMMSSSSTTCLAPTGYVVNTSLTNTYNFPTYAWNMPSSSTIGTGNETIANASNAYLGLVSTYVTGGSGLPSTYSWLSAGDYFYQLMSYVGGVENLNGAVFAVQTSQGINSATGLPGNLGTAGNAWAGIPSGGSNNTIPYLTPCGTAPCVIYPTSGFPSTSATTSINGAAFLEGIMLPLVAVPNMATSPIYVVGNFENLQVNADGSVASPMSTATSVLSSGSSDISGLLSIFSGYADDLYGDIKNLTNIDNTATNPITILMQIGNDMINMVFDTWVACVTYSYLAVLSVSWIPCVTVSYSIGILFVGFFSLIITLVTPLLAAGAMLLFYFPMIPFMIYTFGVIGWVFGVIEGMVAAPIVGIGIMHPEGHDIFGKGEQALMLLLNMFLRPPLMVFGLITSIMMVYVSVWLVNSGINNAINTVTAQTTNWSSMVAEIAIPIVYTVIIFNIVEKCFSMIHILPDKVTRWLSGGMQESLGSDMAGVQGQIKQGVQAGMSGIGSSLGKAAEGAAGSSLKVAEKIEKDKEKGAAATKAAASGGGE